jgi:hypothetical protein
VISFLKSLEKLELAKGFEPSTPTLAKALAATVAILLCQQHFRRASGNMYQSIGRQNDSIWHYCQG